MLLDEHWVDPGTHTPPQLLPTQALAQVDGAPHCPSLPHVRTCVLLAHCVVPGMQTPPQAVPMHAYVQADGGPHWPLMLHVWSCVLEEHCVEPGVHEPVHTPLVQMPTQGDPSSPHWPMPSHR